MHCFVLRIASGLQGLVVWRRGVHASVGCGAAVGVREPGCPVVGSCLCCSRVLWCSVHDGDSTLTITFSDGRAWVMHVCMYAC
jgi:hypothetical protein